MDTSTGKQSSQTIKDFFEININSSGRKPNLIESDDGKEVVNSTFTSVPIKKNLKSSSRHTSKGANFVEPSNPTIGNLPKKPSFEKRNDIWIDKKISKTKNFYKAFFN